MNLLDLLARMKRYDKNAEVIFDEKEPIGAATDLVMPRRPWFRRKNERPSARVTSAGRPIRP